MISKLIFLKKKNLLILISMLILIAIPFFWMKPGEMDLGGDGSRLYFYDPIHYLQNFSLYAISPIGINSVNPAYFFLPFNLLLVILIKILNSSYLIITLFNSFYLVVSFLSMYGIMRELLYIDANKKLDQRLINLCSFFVGIYYIFSPVIIRTEWDRAIFTHSRIFLSPLVFYFLLKFFNTSKTKYLLIVVLITFIFSTNFSWAGGPSLFSFYPIAIVYLFIYAIFVKKTKINLKGILVSSVFFFLVHAFHLIPFITGMPSIAYNKAFSAVGKLDTGLGYFTGSAAHIRLTDNLLGLPQLVPSIIPYEFLFFIVPFFLVIGLIKNEKNKTISYEKKFNYRFIFLFFLISLFFATANITNMGFEFYKSLFNIPGFSMFRNFYGQWLLPYVFFLSIILGYSLFYFLSAIKKSKVQNLFLALLIILLISSAFPFIRGDMINTVLNQGAKTTFHVPIIMDPKYEDLLSYIRRDQVDGKFITLPHSESFNQVLIGSQRGMYIGPSTISQLTGKSDFNGYQVFPPFNEVFLSLSKEKDYKSLGVLFSILNVKYVFYNANPQILDVFPNFPYAQYLRQFLPDKQAQYAKYVGSLPLSIVKNFGPYYKIYKLNDEFYLPHIFVAKKVVFSDSKQYAPWGQFTDIFFKYKPGYEIRTAYIRDNKISKENFNSIPKLIFYKVNPTKYYIEVLNSNKPFFLVFSDAFNSEWRLFLSDKKINAPSIEKYFNGDVIQGQYQESFLNKDTFETIGLNEISKNNHFVANGYANGWYISPKDVSGKTAYTLILEMEIQQTFYKSLTFSFLGLAACIVLLYILLSKRTKI